MRIYFTDNTRPDARDIARLALSEAKELGQIASHVGFRTLEEGHPNSQARRQGFETSLEIKLDALTRDRGRKLRNGAPYGSEDFAATYDEWGFFLAAIYRIDPNARCGANWARDTAIYYDAKNFHDITGRTYDPSYPNHVEEFGDDYGYRNMRNQVGRRGAGRIHFEVAKHYDTEDPRTADFLRALQRGETF